MIASPFVAYFYSGFICVTPWNHLVWPGPFKTHYKFLVWHNAVHVWFPCLGCQYGIRMWLAIENCILFNSSLTMGRRRLFHTWWWNLTGEHSGFLTWAWRTHRSQTTKIPLIERHGVWKLPQLYHVFNSLLKVITETPKVYSTGEYTGGRWISLPQKNVIRKAFPWHDIFMLVLANEIRCAATHTRLRW